MITILSLTALGIWTGFLAFLNSSRDTLKSRGRAVAAPRLKLSYQRRVDSKEPEVWKAFRDLLTEVFYGR